jgi:hypothetical protein
MKNIINCPFIPIAKRAASHRGAQGVMYGDQIREKYGHCDVNYGGEITDHNSYDALWVYHGNDYSVDSVDYESSNDGTTLTMTKKKKNE